MTQEQKDFIKANEAFFKTNTRVERDVVTKTYEIYNDVFNKNKKPNGCYRCWNSVKNELYKKYLETNV